MMKRLIKEGWENEVRERKLGNIESEEYLRSFIRKI